MATTTWDQKAGMTSPTDTDNLENYAEQAEAAKDAAAASETAAAASAAAAAASELDAESAESNAATSATAASGSASSAASSATAAASSATSASSSETAAAASEAGAATSATNAATSATSASGSASSASTDASAASTSATASAASATAASASQTNAAASETAAATSETNAAASETAAATSATNAAASETSAATSASTATTKASEALSSASAASASETNAAASEAAAASSETASAASEAAALASETAAAVSEANASASASTASTAATTATTQASSATSSASSAATSEANAATSETNAASSEAAAATSASAASTSAANAATSETNSASSATAAASSATSASASADAALAALDSFDDRYLGQKASDPALDNDGNALVAGALYFNTTDDIMKVYDGSVWVAAYASLSGALLQSNNLSDVLDVAASRTNLGLGTAATTASTAYATAAQGDLADSAVQPNDSPTFSGLSTTGDVSFGDNDKAIFGAGSDLQIYHSGSHSYIDDAGTGNLYIRSTNFRINNAGDTKQILAANDGADVQLFHNGNLKLATTSTGIGVTGSVTVSGTVDGRDVAADGSKLDGIEAGATADQTAGEIKTAYESNANTNAYTDAEQSKLAGIASGAEVNTVDSVNTQTGAVVLDADDISDAATTNKFTTAAEISKLAGIEAGANVTDTANVTAAGALMDSEVTNLAQVKAFSSADYATAAQGSLADSALQSGDNVSALTNDAGYTTNVGDITGVTAGAGISGGGTTGTVTVSHADTSSQGSVNNSGATIIQDVTLDTYGHVTALGSHTLTLADLGYTGATNANYITNNNQLTNGAGYTTNVGDITGVTAGNGLTGGGSSGSVTLSMSGSYTGDFTASGNVTAYSDERLKSNIETIDNAIDTVKKLRGVTFEKDGQGSLGVIAQEVQKVLPELVLEGDEYLSVAYGNMVGLLIEAIKEQQEQIEALKDKVK